MFPVMIACFARHARSGDLDLAVLRAADVSSTCNRRYSACGSVPLGVTSAARGSRNAASSSGEISLVASARGWCLDPAAAAGANSVTSGEAAASTDAAGRGSAATAALIRIVASSAAPAVRVAGGASDGAETASLSRARPRQVSSSAVPNRAPRLKRAFNSSIAVMSA